MATRARIPIDGEEIARFCERNRIRRLALFGSVLRDDFDDESDVDMLVEFEPDAKVGFRFTAVQRDLGELIGRSVDLATPASLSKYIRGRVLQSAEDLYVRR